jgi:hypothetical protein
MSGSAGTATSLSCRRRARYVARLAGPGRVAEFLTRVRPPAAPDRMLATVLFSDIVGSLNRRRGLGIAAGERYWTPRRGRRLGRHTVLGGF